MERLLELSAVLIVCGTFVLLIWLLKSLLVTPVPTDENTLLYMVIAAKGGGSGLEQTVQSLIWLRDEGSAPMELVICDCGLDEDGRRIMELAAGKWDLACCKPKTLNRLIGDVTWRTEQIESEVQ